MEIQHPNVIPHATWLRHWSPILRLCRHPHSERLCHRCSAFVQALRTDAEASGLEFAFNNRVVEIEDGFHVVPHHDRPSKMRVTCLINAAGLYADDIASVACRTAQVRDPSRSGRVLRSDLPGKRSLIGRLIYPALPRQATGKGIHFSPRPNGQLFVGPNELPSWIKRTILSRKTPPGHVR